MKKKYFVFSILILFTTLFFACKQETIDEDITPPAVVTEVKVEAKEGKIILTWIDPSDEDFYAAKVSLGIEADENVAYKPGVLISKDTQKYEVSDLEEEKTYLFKISTIDNNLNESEAVFSEKVVYKAKTQEVTKYTCPECKKEYDTAEEAANCCKNKREKKSETISAGTFKIFYFQQSIESIFNYSIVEDEVKTFNSDFKIKDISKDFTGFYLNSYSCDSDKLYLFYNRKQVSYTFDLENTGTFADGTNKKVITGLYGYTVNNPVKPTSNTATFRRWSDADGNAVPEIYGLDNLTFNAIWSGLEEDFVLISSDRVTTNIFVAGSSFIFASPDFPVNVDSFYMAKNELTYSDWKIVYDWAIANGYTFANAGQEGRGEDTDHPLTGNGPVTCINWRDAMVWCNAASEKEGLKPVYYFEGTTDFNQSLAILRVSEGDISHTDLDGVWHERFSAADKAIVNPNANGYRLPTELEWEFAARGGDSKAEAWLYKFAGSDDINDVAWFVGNSGLWTHDVKTQTPNTAGLYDMSGNVWEWCWTPELVAGSTERYLRGGCWEDPYDYCAITSRSALRNCNQGIDIGFRLARSVVEE